MKPLSKTELARQQRGAKALALERGEATRADPLSEAAPMVQGVTPEMIAGVAAAAKKVQQRKWRNAYMREWRAGKRRGKPGRKMVAGDIGWRDEWLT